MIPKFRAWEKSLKEMIPVYNIDYRNRLINKDGWRRFDEIVLMQFTGILDKNGVEIFEGDIVKTTRFFGRADEIGGFYEYDKELIGIVKQLEGAWVINTARDAVFLWTEIEENEVLGNIYETPDLMEESYEME